MLFIALDFLACSVFASRNLRENLKCESPVGGFASQGLSWVEDSVIAPVLSLSSAPASLAGAVTVTYRLPSEEVGLSECF